MSDLQERLARALPYYHEGTSHEAELFYSVAWWRCRKCGVQWYGTQVPAICKPLPPAIDWSVVPFIFAECERLEWDVETTYSSVAKQYMVVFHSDRTQIGMPTDTLPEALAEAFCTAVENVTKYNS